MAGLWQDIRHAMRCLASDPAFALAATFTLALGIGVNLAVFGAARVVFFPSLPFSHPDSLVAIYEQAPRQGITKFPLPYLNYLAVRDLAGVFGGVALYIEPDAMMAFDLTEPGELRKVPGAVVSANFFELLGVRPMLGRTFDPSSGSGEEQPDAVIGYRLWQELFGGSRSALGKPVALNQRVYYLAGVMPPGFSFPKDAEVWLAGSSPATVSAIMNSGGPFVELLPRAVGALRPGVSSTQAEALLQAMLAHLTEPHLPGTPSVTLGLVPLYKDLYGDARRSLGILTAAAAFVLLTAWVVVSILCWARTTRRDREIAVRAVLGAGKGRAIRQLIVENNLVALAGAGAAILIGEWTAKIIPALAPSQGLSTRGGLLDWHVLLYLAAIAALSATAPGMWSAWWATKLDLARTLQEGSHLLTAGRGRSRLLTGFVAVLAGLAFVLTAGAALALENFYRATTVPLGWNPRSAWVSSFNLHGSASPSRTRLAVQYSNALREIQGLPGVEAAAIADSAPMSGPSFELSVLQAEGSTRLPEEGLAFPSIPASPDYFKVWGIPLLRGRWLSEADCAQGAEVAVVDHLFAQHFWGDSNPLGRRIILDNAVGRALTVVGVVGAATNSGYFSPPEPTIYVPIPQSLFASASYLCVRMRGRAAPPIAGIRDALSAVSAGIVPSQPVPAERLLDASGARARARSFMLSLFALLALGLAAAGSYAVTSYVVRQRTHELGIRLALGATRGGIVRLLMQQTLRPLLIGLSAGWIVALSLAPVFRTLMYGARATNPAIFAIVTAALSCAILAASLLPALRTAALNPVNVLRHE
jgi:putative ABC transport system permease protein